MKNKSKLMLEALDKLEYKASEIITDLHENCDKRSDESIPEDIISELKSLKDRITNALAVAEAN